MNRALLHCCIDETMWYPSAHRPIIRGKDAYSESGKTAEKGEVGFEGVMGYNTSNLNK